MIGVPLAYIKILIIVHADIMTMLEDSVGSLQGGLQLTILIGWDLPSRIGDHFVVHVQDSDKTRITIDLLSIGIFGPANTGIDILSVGDRTADIHPRQVDPADEFPIQGKDLETIFFPRSADESWISLIPVVDTDPMRILEIVILVGIMMPPEMADIFTLGRILNDVVGTISIRNIDIPVWRNGRLRRFEGLVVLIDPNGAGMPDGEQQAAVEVSLHHLPGLSFPFPISVLVPSAIRYQQEVITPFPGNGQTMTTGECRTPIIQQLARLIEDEDIVLCTIAEHDQAALAVLHHFMAIEQGGIVEADLSPALIHFIGKGSMADHRIFRHAILVKDRKGWVGPGQAKGGDHR